MTSQTSQNNLFQTALSRNQTYRDKQDNIDIPSRQFRTSPSLVDFRSVSGTNRLAAQTTEIKPKQLTYMSNTELIYNDGNRSLNKFPLPGSFQTIPRTIDQIQNGITDQTIQSMNTVAGARIEPTQSSSKLTPNKVLSWSTMLNPNRTQHLSGTVSPKIRPDSQSHYNPNSRLVLGTSVSSIPQTIEMDDMPTYEEWDRMKSENIELKARIKQMEEDQYFVLDLNQLLLQKLDVLSYSLDKQAQGPSLNEIPMNGFKYYHLESQNPALMNERLK